MFTPIKPTYTWNNITAQAIAKYLIFATCKHFHTYKNNNGHGQIELNSKCFNVNLSNDIDTAENA